MSAEGPPPLEPPGSPTNPGILPKSGSGDIERFIVFGSGWNIDSKPVTDRESPNIIERSSSSPAAMPAGVSLDGVSVLA